MWSFSSVASIGQAWGQWYALITLTKGDVPESFYLNFTSEPTPAQADAAGIDLALKKNLEEAPAAPGDSVPREVFFGRFTNTEITAIYQASAQNADLFAYIKKLEMNPTVNKTHADVINGVQLLESAGLLGAGRSGEILG